MLIYLTLHYRFIVCGLLKIDLIIYMPPLPVRAMWVLYVQSDIIVACHRILEGVTLCNIHYHMHLRSSCCVTLLKGRLSHQFSDLDLSDCTSSQHMIHSQKAELVQLAKMNT